MKPGQLRHKKRFLLLPKEIAGEIRWLEKAEWEEVFDPNYPFDMWRPTKWLN